ncbi:MAG: DUF1996 domain-containing protein [Ilumatobacteraceae bacterium]
MRRGFARRAGSVGALLGVVSLVGGCAPDGPSSVHLHNGGVSIGQPDEVIAGPQGRVPQFVVECAFSHAAQDDPIVWPGQPGMSHLHVFFGSTETNASSTTADLVAGDSTCDNQRDRAAYWSPALMNGQESIDPVKSTAYYRPGIGVDPQIVNAFPEGFTMVAGNSAATEEQPVSIVAWGCGAGIERSALPIDCGGERNLRLIVTFPDCWDGANLDSPDHHAHVAYSSKGVCPASHPVPVLQLQFAVEYDWATDPTGLVLASGGQHTGHADFMNGWVQEVLETETRLCIHGEVVCGIASGRTDG